MDIQIPFNNYKLNIEGLNLGVVENTISKNGLSVTAEIDVAYISDKDNDITFGGYAGETISFGIYFEGNGDTPIMSGSMSSYQLSVMPVDMYAFYNVTAKTETTKFNWEDINFPSNAIWIKIFDGRSSHDTPIILPNLSVSNITYDSALVTVYDTSQTHAYALYKENGNGVREREAGQQNISTLPFTNLEMGTDYVLWIDSANGLLNFLRFSTLGAPVWVKTDSGYKKGKLWVKTSNGWEKAKGIYGRKRLTDEWEKGI